MCESSTDAPLNHPRVIDLIGLLKTAYFPREVPDVQNDPDRSKQVMRSIEDNPKPCLFGPDAIYTLLYSHHKGFLMAFAGDSESFSATFAHREWQIVINREVDVVTVGFLRSLLLTSADSETGRRISCGWRWSRRSCLQDPRQR